MELKTCKSCKTEYPKTPEYFRFCGTKKYNGVGYAQSHCKKCDYKRIKPSINKFKQEKPNQYQKSFNKWENKLGKGVYGMFEKGKCLYVGESGRLNARFSNHLSCLRNPERAVGVHKELYYNLIQHDLEMGILENTDTHVRREQYYINKYKPIYNEK